MGFRLLRAFALPALACAVAISDGLGGSFGG